MSTIRNDNRLEKLSALARKLGAQEGSGELSRFELFNSMFLAASQDYLVSDLKDKANDGVEPIVLDYIKARQSKNKFHRPDEDKKVTAQVSKFRNAATVGGAPMFRAARNGGNQIAQDWLALCDARIAALAARELNAVPVFQKLVKICTTQKAKIEKDNATVPMDADAIDAALNEDTAPPSELKDLRAIQSKLVKLGKNWPAAKETAEAALAVIKPRIATLESAEAAQDLADTLASFTPEQIEAALAAKRKV